MRRGPGTCTGCARVLGIVAKGQCSTCYLGGRACQGCGHPRRVNGDGLCHTCAAAAAGPQHRNRDPDLPQLGPRALAVIAYRGGPLAFGELTCAQADALADVLAVWRRAGLGDGLRERLRGAR